MAFNNNDDNIKIALNVSMVEFAQAYGIELRKSGRGWQIMGEYKTKGHSIIENFLGVDKIDMFKQFNNDKAGNNIQFAMEYLDMSKGEAIRELVKFAGYDPYEKNINNKPFTPQLRPKPIAKEEPPRVLRMPPKANDTNKVFDYLTKTRGIDETLANYLIKEDIVQQLHIKTENYKFDNIAFVGFDYKEPDKPKYCSMRSMVKKRHLECSGSNKEFGFKIPGKGNKLLVFESPIDAMSHVTLCKLMDMEYKDNRLAMGGLSDKPLEKYLDNNPNIDTIVFCCDNDKDKEINVGQEFAHKMKNKYVEKGFNVEVRPPEIGKDFNEELLTIKQEGFIIEGETDKLLVFDTPGNALAHTYLCDLVDFKCTDTKIADCNNSTNSIDNFLKNNPNIKNVEICFSNDNQANVENLFNKYTQKGFNVTTQKPKTNNFKQDLKKCNNSLKQKLEKSKDMAKQSNQNQETKEKPKDKGR